MVAPATDAQIDSRPRWGVRHALGTFLAAQVLSALGVAIFVAVKGIDASDLDQVSIGETALLQIPLWAGLLGLPLLVTTILGSGPVRELGLRMRRSDAPLGLLIGLASQFVLVPLVTLPILLLFDIESSRLEEPARELTDRATGAGVALLVLVVVIGAPVAEEVFFRGMLQRALARRLSLAPTVLLTSVTFGISHFQLLQLPALIAFGAVLSVIVHRRGDLGMAIWAHVGFNAATVTVLLLTR